jgi:hypothetical protein
MFMEGEFSEGMSSALAKIKNFGHSEFAERFEED